MSLSDLATLGKTLGIPGVMILVWFLLEKGRGERAHKLDEQRIAADNKKTGAMEEGFRSLANMVADHAQTDTESHGAMTERLAAIETQLGIRKTPARGIPIQEIQRTRARDGDR